MSIMSRKQNVSLLFEAAEFDWLAAWYTERPPKRDMDVWMPTVQTNFKTKHQKTFLVLSSKCVQSELSQLRTVSVLMQSCLCS